MKPIWLIGNPVSHSLSPIFQNAALEYLNIQAEYSVREVNVHQLGEIMTEMRSSTALGANITIPYKTEVMQYMDEIDPFAKKVGAVNTVLVDRNSSETRLVGYNTDVRGIINPIMSSGFQLTNSRAILIGTGGAALSAFQALESIDIDHIDILARNIAAASTFTTRPTLMDVEIHDLARISHVGFTALINSADIIIQATPVGMSSGLVPDESPVPENILKDGLVGKLKQTLIFELVYACLLYTSPSPRDS